MGNQISQDNTIQNGLLPPGFRKLFDAQFNGTLFRPQPSKENVEVGDCFVVSINQKFFTYLILDKIEDKRGYKCIAARFKDDGKTFLDADCVHECHFQSGVQGRKLGRVEDRTLLDTIKRFPEVIECYEIAKLKPPFNTPLDSNKAS